MLFTRERDEVLQLPDVHERSLLGSAEADHYDWGAGRLYKSSPADINEIERLERSMSDDDSFSQGREPISRVHTPASSDTWLIAVVSEA
jgi:hypothetical protein